MEEQIIALLRNPLTIDANRHGCNLFFPGADTFSLALILAFTITLAHTHILALTLTLNLPLRHHITSSVGWAFFRGIDRCSRVL